MIARPDTGDRERSCTGGKQEKRWTVVVVNDHAVFRQALAVLLERLGGFEVCAEVGSPAEARETLGTLTTWPDLVILDLDLGGRGAGDLARELCDRPSETGVICLTKGGGPAGVPERMRVLGTDVSVDEILAAARQLVG